MLTSILGDYCDVYLTHDSMSVRKAHNTGKNHLRNVVEYYQRTCPRDHTSKPPPLTSLFLLTEIGHDRAQSVIDSITNSYAAEGQAGANPMLNPPGGAGGPAFPPNMNFPGKRETTHILHGQCSDYEYRRNATFSTRRTTSTSRIPSYVFSPLPQSYHDNKSLTL